MRTKIRQMAEAVKQDLFAFTRQLIATPSFSGKEGGVIQYLKMEMVKSGYERVWVDDFGNLLGIIGTGERLIALDGHCDTVGIGNPESWLWDPFLGNHQDGIIYGRGAADQKGGLAAALFAGKIVKEIGLPANTSLLVVASVLEEDAEGLCWKYIIEEDKIKPHAMLLTEPSSLGIMIGQRGRMEIKIQTTGISCHGSAPEQGDNAIYKILPIIQEIEELNNTLSSTSMLGKGTIAVTDIRSSAPSLCAIPDNAIIHLDRRLSEGETLETVQEELSKLPAVQKSAARITVPENTIQTYTRLKYPVKAYYPLWLMNSTHPLVQTAVSAYQNQFAEKAGLGVWQFSTNGVATRGVFNIPTIGFGPGSEKYAHTSMDQVNENDLVKALEFYVAFIYEWS